MHLLPFLALAETPGGSAFDQMLRLIGIAAIIVAFFKGVKSLIPKPAAPSSNQPPAPASAGRVPQPAAAGAADADGITAEIIAIIAAAVATATDSSRRIVAIKSQTSHWEKAGRQSVLTSHRIR